MGVLLLMATLYFIGLKQSLFGDTLRLQVQFKDVAGLQEGNNVRLSGINVGSVKSVEIINDTTVLVTMRVENDVQRFVRKNSTVSLGSDGLMGNRLLNIEPGTPNQPVVQDGDMLTARQTASTEQIMETIQKTGNNAEKITAELTKTIDKINNGEGTIGMLLNDKELVTQLKLTVENAQATSRNAAAFTRDLSTIVRGAKNGEGTLGMLLADTTMAGSLKATVSNLRLTTQKASALSDSLTLLIDKVSNGDGPVSVALNDTVMSRTLQESMHNIRQVTEGLNQIMGDVQDSKAFRSLKEQRQKKREEKAALQSEVEK